MSEYPQLPLDTWRAYMSYQPFAFWGLTGGSLPAITSQCNTLVNEYAWQNADAVGRHEIRAGIGRAEDRLAEYLGYHVGQHWVQETLQYPTPFEAGKQFVYPVGGDGRWLSIRAKEGYIRNCGVETRTAISTNVAVTYSDSDGDGVEDMFTLTANTSLTDPEQIAVYFSSADRLLIDPALSERYRVKPVYVSISGGVVTIRGHKWLCVKPVKYQGIAGIGQGLDVSTAGNFVTTLDIYRHYTNPAGTTLQTAQAVLVWETSAYPGWATCCGGGTSGEGVLLLEDGDGLVVGEGGTLVSSQANSADPAAQAFAIARAGIRDARLGEITVGESIYNSTLDEFFAVDWGACRQPDRVILRYEAGAKLASIENTLSQSRVDGSWDGIVSRFGAAEMSRRICACDVANKELYRWQVDYALQPDGGDRYNVGSADLENPLGTSAGAVYAWKQVKNLMIGRAYLMG